MRHFAHNIGDYAAATAHLSFIEDAAYHRILRRYYQDEKPLPPDVPAVARLAGARTKEERQAVANVLAEFFTLEDDGYHQSRADREIEAYQSKAQAARENGTKGGRPINREKTKTVSAQVRSKKLTTPHSPLPTPQGSEAASSDAARELVEVDEAFALWSSLASDLQIPDTGFLNGDRRAALHSRLHEIGGIDGWALALERIRAAEFFFEPNGKPKRWLNLGWLLKPENFTGLMEGRYAERHRNNGQSGGGLAAALSGLADGPDGQQLP